jgi:hypothetical protein
MRAQVGFLTNPSTFEVSLPDNLVEEAPEACAVWSYMGERDITYIPADRFVPLSRPEFVAELNMEYAETPVSIYRRTDAAATYCATWQLKEGVLQTFANDPIGSSSDLVSVVQAIEISERPVLPAISFREPLERPEPKSPSLKNRCTFVAVDGQTARTRIEFTESVPGVASPAASAGRATAAATNRAGLAITAISEQMSKSELVELVEAIDKTVTAV